jgi:hypothetical protein
MKAKTRQWRVVFTHKMGYQAPHILVETDALLKYEAKMQAIEIAKAFSRLADFNDLWKTEVTCTERKVLDHKWFPLSEYTYKVDKRNQKSRKK